MSRRKKNAHKRAQTGEFNPRFLKNGVMMATGTLVVCLFMAAGMVERVVKEMGSPYVAAVIAAVLVELANNDRTALALDGLSVNPTLVAAAQAKANDMASKGYFSHTTPEGYDSWHWFKEVGYDYQYAGENLAVNFSDSGDVQKAWMMSPTHRQNIMSARYTEIGIATAVGMYQGKEAVFAVQMFGRPKANSERPTVSAASPVVADPSVPPSVLGEAVIAPEEDATLGALAEQDGDAAILSTNEIPWWGWLIAQPRQSLQYAYYLIGLLIIAGLFLDFEWEIHKHHIRHAMKAGTLLATMSALFIAADWVFFAEPLLAVMGLG